MADGPIMGKETSQVVLTKPGIVPRDAAPVGKHVGQDMASAVVSLQKQVASTRGGKK